MDQTFQYSNKDLPDGLVVISFLSSKVFFSSFSSVGLGTLGIGASDWNVLPLVSPPLYSSHICIQLAFSPYRLDSLVMCDFLPCNIHNTAFDHILHDNVHVYDI